MLFFYLSQSLFFKIKTLGRARARAAEIAD